MLKLTVSWETTRGLGCTSTYFSRNRQPDRQCYSPPPSECLQMSRKRWMLKSFLCPRIRISQRISKAGSQADIRTLHRPKCFANAAQGRLIVSRPMENGVAASKQ